MRTMDLMGLEIEHTNLQKFADFHAANPQVCERLEELAAGLWNAGRRRIGIKMLFEVLRWQHQMRTFRHEGEFKLNNNFTAHYARLIVARHPEWDGLFELRKMRESTWEA